MVMYSYISFLFVPKDLEGLVEGLVRRDDAQLTIEDDQRNRDRGDDALSVLAG